MFKFKLEKLLKYKEELEKSAERALAVAIDGQGRLDGLLQQVGSRLQVSFSESQTRRLHDSVHMDFFRASLCRSIEELKEQMEDAKLEVEACHSKLIAARKERLLLEKLKEKQLQDYLAEVNYKEQVVSDDLVTVRFRYGSV